MTVVGAQKLKKVFMGAEQAVLSLLSFCLAMAAGRILSPYEYGILTFSLATSLLIGGVHRNVIILPFVADAFSSDRLILSGRLWEAASLLVKIVTAGMAVIILQGFGISLGLEWMKVSSYCVAPIVLSQCAFEFYRRWQMILLQTSALWIAALSNMLVVGVGSLSVMYFFPSTIAFSLVVACGNLAAATVCWLEIKPCSAPRFVGCWSLMKDHRRAALVGVFSHVAFSLYAISPPIYVGFNLGPGAVAVYSATRLLSTPLERAVGDTRYVRVW